jgi:GT2 family glycosyltransferase
MNMEFVVGIPTLNRYDLLDKCIKSIWNGSLVPNLIIIVDNGNGYETKYSNVQVNRPDRNLGVAASWNFLHAISQSHTLIISNDDIIFGNDSLKVILDTDGELVVPNGDIGWACFKQSHDLWRKIGPYDEKFWPAYFEDNDYRYRMKLKGISVTHANHYGIYHLTGSTSKNKKKELWQENKEYYIKKWGGQPYFETYKIPFNRNKIVGGKSGFFK